MNKSYTRRKICIKQIGFLTWLLVNLIWLNDFGGLIFSKSICGAREQLTLESHKWYSVNTNKLLWLLRGGRKEFLKGHLKGSWGMSRSVTDLEGKGIARQGLCCEIRFQPSSRYSLHAPSSEQKSILGPALFSKMTVLVGQKQAPQQSLPNWTTVFFFSGSDRPLSALLFAILGSSYLPPPPAKSREREWRSRAFENVPQTTNPYPSLYEATHR